MLSTLRSCNIRVIEDVYKGINIVVVSTDQNGGEWGSIQLPLGERFFSFSL